MILVAGGTGRLGRLVVAGLAARGERVRVLTRDAVRAGPPSAPLVEVVQGDVRDPSTLPPALAGVRVVVSAVHGLVGPGRVTPASVDRDGNANLVAAARAVGAEMVMMSVVGAAPNHSMELFRMKAIAEINLCASGVPWTVVRANAFLELYEELLRRSAGKSNRPLVFGRGENPINFVSVTEVADVVVRAALDPSMRGQTVEVVGPRNLTLNELAAQCQRQAGQRQVGQRQVGQRQVGQGQDGQLQDGGVGKAPRHVPRPVLRGLAASRFVVQSGPARLAHAALIMDTTDMTSGTHHQ